MEVRIGIKHSPRELTFETDSGADEIRRLIEDASKGGAALVALSDSKGRQYLIDVDSIGYIELGSGGGRRVGFVS